MTKMLFLPLIDWTWGIIGGAILFSVFAGLALFIYFLIRNGSKKE